MARYREITYRDEARCTMTLWPGEELRDGADTVELEQGEAYIRIVLDLRSVHYEVNQVCQSDGSEQSVMTWCLLGHSVREFVVAERRGGEPGVTGGVEVTLIPASANTVHLTAPVSGLGIRSAALRIFVQKEHLEVLRDQVAAGHCGHLEAIVRFALLHHAEEAIYLLDDGQEYEGAFESLRAEVGVSPARDARPPEDLHANVATAPAAHAITPGAELARVGAIADRVLRQQRFIIGVLGVLVALLLVRSF
jgi:hypothetical protein